MGPIDEDEFTRALRCVLTQLTDARRKAEWLLDVESADAEERRAAAAEPSSATRSS
jgi:hypothetical protein